MLKVLTGPYKGRNGEMTITKGWDWGLISVTLYGGPFKNFEDTEPGAFGLNLKAEQPDKRATLYLPIRDFQVPSNDKDVAEVLYLTLSAAISGRKVYVGCMGGWGRTGLMLALMAKVLDVPDPVGFVRAHYTPHAVETEKQHLYVTEFDVTEVQAALRTYARRGRWRRWLVSLWSRYFG